MAETVRQVDYFYMEVPNKIGEGANRCVKTLPARAHHSCGD